MLRTAIVGLGRWGRVLVESVQGASALIRFTAGVARTPANVRDFADRNGIALFSSLEEVLQLDAIDAVVLATPHGQHYRQILEAIAAKKHVFVEKPMVMTLAEAIAANTAARSAGVTLCVGHNRRFLPAYAALRDIAEAHLGERLQLMGNFSWATSYTSESWRSSETESPAGGMTGMGIHVIDAMIGLGARAEDVTVTTRRCGHMGLEDTVTALLSFQDGTLGTLTTMVRTAQIWRLEAFGTAGWVAMDGETRLVHAAASRPLQIFEFPRVSSERLELEAFARAVNGAAPYPVAQSEVEHGIAILEATVDAARDGPGRVSSRRVASPR